MRHLAILAYLILIVQTEHKLLAQTPLSVNFLLSYNGAPVAINDETKNTNPEKTTITTCRFYISQVELINDKNTVWTEKSSNHLIDASLPGSCQLTLPLPKADLNYNGIRFRLGIDSATNVAGVMGGDLDPSKGMYWTWQTGYINMKIEGTSPDCTTRKNEFQFHLGGYAFPYATSGIVTLQTTARGVINIVADLSYFLAEIDLKTQNSIMIPGKEAVHLSEVARSMFRIPK